MKKVTTMQKNVDLKKVPKKDRKVKKEEKPVFVCIIIIILELKTEISYLFAEYIFKSSSL